MSQQKKILVTGAHGFIGSKLHAHALSKGHQVSVLTKDCNIKDLDAILQQYGTRNFDYIYHFAAKSSVQKNDQNQYDTFQTNTVGTMNIMELAKTTRAKAVFIASTQRLSTIKDHHFPNSGASSYDISKFCAEQIAFSYAQQYNIPAIILRLAIVFGEGDKSHSRLIPGIIKSLINDKMHEINSPGNTLRHYIYLADAINAIWYLTENYKRMESLYSIYDISYPEAISIKEIVSQIVSMAEKPDLMPLTATTDNKQDEIIHVVNAANVCELDWKPSFTMQAGLEKTYNWYKQHQQEWM